MQCPGASFMRTLNTPLLMLLIFSLVACTASADNQSTEKDQVQQGLSNTKSYIACPATTNTKAESAAKQPVTLTISGWISSSAEEKLVRANLQNFHRAHPDIQVKWVPINGDYPAQIHAAIASNNAPDVFYLQPDMAPDYITAGQLLNLSPYMARDHIQTNDYYPSFITPFSCKSGQVYGLPKDWNTLGVFYNKQMFQQAHVSFPASGWTWDTMHTLAQKLTHGGNTPTYGTTLPAAASRWLAFLFADGGSVLNSDGTRATFNSPAGVESLNFYSSFQNQYHSAMVPTDLVSANWDGAAFDAFGKQRAAMVVEGGWLIPYMQQNFASVQYGIAPLPTAPNGKQGNLIFTNAWSAYGNTKHPEAAWELIKYMTGQQVQQSQLHAGFALPTLKSLANDPYFQDNPDVKVLFDAASYGVADSYGPHSKFIHNKLDFAITNILFRHEDTKEALDNAAQQVDQVLQQ